MSYDDGRLPGAPDCGRDGCIEWDRHYDYDHVVPRGERIHFNSEDNETGEFLFANMTPKTARNLVTALHGEMDSFLIGHALLLLEDDPEAINRLADMAGVAHSRIEKLVVNLARRMWPTTPTSWRERPPV